MADELVTRRRLRAAVVLVTVALVASGCSLREVRLWFAVRHHPISRQQAKKVADVVNAKIPPGGCDGNYAGGCVPDNATQVHCAGAPGEGPAVRGPLTVTGWDSFGLDPDGDKHACDSPVGAFDLFGQEFGGIGIRGWAFDPDTTAPIRLAISLNGYVEFVDANGSRGDLAAALPGVGEDHGFDLGPDFDPGSSYRPGLGSTNDVCVVALNVGTGTNTTLGCKSIYVDGYGEQAAGAGSVYAMLEGADVVPGGIRVRGFVVNTTGTPVRQQIFSAVAQGPSVTLHVVRNRVADWFSVPTGLPYGFDQVIPTTAGTPSHGVLDAGAPGLCLRVGWTFPVLDPLTWNCRALNS